MEYALFYAEGAEPVPYDPADEDIADWVADLEARGVAEWGARLRPVEDATVVRVRGDELLVTDGPFTEAKESVGGFDVIDAADLDEAIEIASRHPAARFGQVEIRPFARPAVDRTEPSARIVPEGFDDRPETGRRYFLAVVVDPTGEPEADGDAAAWVHEMDERGVRHFGERLHRPADTTGVRRRDGRVIVTDGPFAESKEWVAGFDLIEASGLAEAVEIAAKHPMARAGLIELRPLWPFDLDDDHVARFEREASESGRRSEPAAADVRDALAEAAR